MRHERSWLVLGWTAVAVFFFYAFTQAFPPVVTGEGPEQRGWRYNTWTGSIDGPVHEMNRHYVQDEENRKAQEASIPAENLTPGYCTWARSARQAIPVIAVMGASAVLAGVYLMGRKRAPDPGSGTRGN